MKSFGWALLFLIWIFSGCTTRAAYNVAVAEERVVSHCTYLGTLAENSDMGALQIHPKFNFEVQDRVLQKAEMLGATHLVWLADYPIGASAMIYYCGN